jgi:dTDP-4-amino-4,6-dideoxygalactose transaminase
MIHLHNLNRLNKELNTALIKANDLVLKSGRVMMGEYTLEFESRIAKVSGANYACVVGSGSDALLYALVSSNTTGLVGMPAQTFIATKNSILRAGCIPYLVDVKNNALLNWDLIPNSVDCAVWVGLFGNSEPLPDNLFVIEDGAQHFGARLQSNIATYSFDPTKSLPNFGNGGAVVSNDKRVIDNVKLLRRHQIVNGHTGGNSIMSERECAEMCVKLDYFPLWQERRQEIARDYYTHLGHLVNCVTQLDGQISKFIIETTMRADLQKYLSHKHIETKRAYEHPIYEFDQASKNCKRFLQLPCDPYMTDEELLAVIMAVKEFFEESPLESLL